MSHRLVSSVVLAVVFVAGPAAADMFVVPYGSYNFFSNFSSSTALEIDVPPEISAFEEVSRLDSGFGGGLVIGQRSETSKAVYGLNIEYLWGKTDQNYYRQVDASTKVKIGNLNLDSPAFAVGAFLGADISGSARSAFRSIVGIEVGALIPSGTTTFVYGGIEETADFGKTSAYVSLFFAEEYMFSDRFGIAGTLGFRALNTKVETIETESGIISGGYAQEYSGLFVRLGLSVAL